MRFRRARFGLKPRTRFLHEFVTIYLANQRVDLGQHQDPRRGVRRRQEALEAEGTPGRARAGSIRSALWRHGGVTFGPPGHEIVSPRFPAPEAPGLALAQALSARAQDGGLVCVKDFALKEPKTKLVAATWRSSGCGARPCSSWTRRIRPRSGRPQPRHRGGPPGGGPQRLRGLRYCKKLMITQPALEKLRRAGTRDRRCPIKLFMKSWSGPS